MPTYEYVCDACGHQFEEFQSITAKPLRKCPQCGASKLERLIGIGAGVLFKGGGFYETDYRSEAYKKAAEAEKGAAAKPAGEGADGGKQTGAQPDAGAAKSEKTAPPADKAPAAKKSGGKKKSAQS